MIAVNRFIEHTNLKPTLTDRDIDVLISEAREYSFSGICIPPFWVKKASRELKEEDINLITVIGFPFGYSMTETKITEIKAALKDGANEVDMVMNISAFKSNMPWVKIELAKASFLVHEQSCLLKVIIETAYLSPQEIETACLLCKDAGVDFVKTSSGYAPSGADVSTIQLMRNILPSSVGIKASGGIKTLTQAMALINAGADRIGTSSGVEIMEEFLKT